MQPDKRTLKRKVDGNESSSSAADLSDKPDNCNQTLKRKVKSCEITSTSSGSDQSGDTVSVIDEDSSSTSDEEGICSQTGDSSKKIGLIFFILCLLCFIFISSCVCFSWVWLSLIIVL